MLPRIVSHISYEIPLGNTTRFFRVAPLPSTTKSFKSITRNHSRNPSENFTWDSSRVCSMRCVRGSWRIFSSISFRYYCWCFLRDSFWNSSRGCSCNSSLEFTRSSIRNDFRNSSRSSTRDQSKSFYRESFKIYSRVSLGIPAEIALVIS